MKKLVPLAALLALSAALAPAFAQAAPGARAGHGGGRIAKLAGTLGLTEAQKAQMKPILKSKRQEARAIREDTSLTPEAKKAQLKALRQTTRDQMLPLLTPDQRAKLAAMKGRRAGRA